MSRATKLLIAGAAAALAAATLGAVPAAADNVGAGEGPSGPFVTARISFTGDVRGGGGTRSVSVPAKCWWTPISANILLGDPPIDASDPESVAGFFEWAMRANGGSFSFARLGLPSQAEIEDAIARVKAGEDITWYVGECVDGVDAIKEGFLRKGGTFQGTDIAVGFQAFPTGNAPEPIVAAETLAQEALKVLYIENPAVDRNPKIGLGGTDAALVTLPTYFWITNVDDALGTPVGLKKVVATAGAASATLTADSTGISISAPAGALEEGAKTCDAELITHEYTAGTPAGDLCSVKFARSSATQGAGGWPVTVASHWDVRWQGVEANGAVAPGGPLALLNPTQSNINVPVAESQAVVDSTNS